MTASATAGYGVAACYSLVADYYDWCCRKRWGAVQQERG